MVDRTVLFVYNNLIEINKYMVYIMREHVYLNDINVLDGKIYAVLSNETQPIVVSSNDYEAEDDILKILKSCKNVYSVNVHHFPYNNVARISSVMIQFTTLLWAEEMLNFRKFEYNPLNGYILTVNEQSALINDDDTEDNI